MRWSKPKAPNVKVGRAYGVIQLEGGPLTGVMILERDLRRGKTLVFTLHGETGRYDHGKWKEVQLG